MLRRKNNNWIRVITIIFAILIIFLLFYAPIKYIECRFPDITNEKDIADLENSYRITLAQILGGTSIFIGIVLTWREVRSIEKNVQLLENSQFNERFTQALKHLNNKKMETRLAGIYELERTFKESPIYSNTIVEILAFYVRKNSRIDNNLGKVPEIDVRVAIDFLKSNHSEVDKLDLSKSCLRSLDFDKVDFSFTNLQKCIFDRADLSETNFTEADLKGASFKVATIEGAIFNNAYLQNANFSGADLVSSEFSNAELEGAIFNNADISDVKFEGADLRFSKFKQTEGISIDELAKAYTLYNAKFDEPIATELNDRYSGLFEKPEDD